MQFFLFLLLGACNASPQQPATPQKTVATQTPSTPAALPEESTVDCSKDLRSVYHKARAALNTCKKQDDCTQIWPGACPDGPYFINAKADVSAVFELEGQIEACSKIECEPPIFLKPAGCVKGRCVEATRSAVPPDLPLKSCWDTQIAYLENNASHSGNLQKRLTGKTPLMIYEATAAGTLHLEVHWLSTCVDCELQISEHNSGMARLIQGKRSKQKQIEQIILPAKSGPYYFVGRSQNSKGSFLLHVNHTTTDGRQPAAGAHGEGWKRFCEG